MIWAPRELPQFKCIICGCRTLGEQGGYEICEICDWEDEYAEYSDTARPSGGANFDYSVDEARSNFKAHGTMFRREDPRFPANPEFLRIGWELQKVLLQIEKNPTTDLYKELMNLRKKRIRTSREVKP